MSAPGAHVARLRPPEGATPTCRPGSVMWRRTPSSHHRLSRQVGAMAAAAPRIPLVLLPDDGAIRRPARCPAVVEALRAAIAAVERAGVVLAGAEGDLTVVDAALTTAARRTVLLARACHAATAAVPTDWRSTSCSQRCRRRLSDGGLVKREQPPRPLRLRGARAHCAGTPGRAAVRPRAGRAPGRRPTSADPPARPGESGRRGDPP